MPLIQDVTGKKFGKLVALERIGQTGKREAIWRCACECGKEVGVRLANLRNGNTKSCGCLRRGK